MAGNGSAVVAPHDELAGPALAAWWRHYDVHCLDHTRPFPGLPELLTRSGRRLAVHTNKPGRVARRIFAGLGLLDRFAIVTGGDEAPRKPDPAGTLATAPKTVGAYSEASRQLVLQMGDAGLRFVFRELAGALSEEQGALVLDVRGGDEFAAGHVEGALNIAYTRLGARLAELPTRRPVYIHCGSGLRASMAASFLAAKGIDVVHVDGNFCETGACALTAS